MNSPEWQHVAHPHSEQPRSQRASRMRGNRIGRSQQLQRCRCQQQQPDEKIRAPSATTLHRRRRIMGTAPRLRGVAGAHAGHHRPWGASRTGAAGRPGRVVRRFGAWPAERRLATGSMRCLRAGATGNGRFHREFAARATGLCFTNRQGQSGDSGRQSRSPRPHRRYTWRRTIPAQRRESGSSSHEPVADLPSLPAAPIASNISDSYISLNVRRGRRPSEPGGRLHRQPGWSRSPDAPPGCARL
jgi:hypothetical protein